MSIKNYNKIHPHRTADHRADQPPEQHGTPEAQSGWSVKKDPQNYFLKVLS